MVRVVVSGASGRMGREVVRAVTREKDLELVGAVDVSHIGEDCGVLAGLEPNGVLVADDLSALLEEFKPDVMVDFTAPTAVAKNVICALEAGVRPVIGTTGMPAADLERIMRLAEERRIGGLVAPNFAIGAVLMMRFAAMAAKFFPTVEIIELHHDQKIDAPSGTAVQTAEMIAAVREDFRANTGREELKLAGARGAEYRGGLRIHSVRLPGLVAHQEVLFGGQGQTLTIRHDSITRESFMPGVILAIRRVMGLDRIVYGLDKLIFE
ncbi:MAG: 4-hydroxy-tetrahydrodipicolinate reductase [Thermoanaerobacterales bacterium]|nr:4-hydroxy-tetrahydrodipicolinate reductase [Bacillota bacterium]MDI6906233.1 4-hydroxy-tetrahydrodipicolinate reductase [Thermoanaerobacterales bacterium]